MKKSHRYQQLLKQGKRCKDCDNWKNKCTLANPGRPEHSPNNLCTAHWPKSD